MARVCEFTGKKVQYGNNVSHANNKTRRRFLPNLFKMSLMSETLDKSYRFRISAYALRCIEHRGGVDAFLLKASDKDLSKRAQLLKRQIMAKKAEIAATDASEQAA